MDKKATKIYSLTSHDDYSNVFFSSLLFLVPIIRARAIVVAVAYVLGFTGAYIAAARKIKIYDACTIISAF